MRPVDRRDELTNSVVLRWRLCAHHPVPTVCAVAFGYPTPLESAVDADGADLEMSWHRGLVHGRGPEFS